MDNVIIKQAPEIIPVLTDPANLWVSVGLAIVTFLALVVALFQERIRKYWNRAILDMEINLTPPDSHKIALSNPTTGQIVGQTIYVRIKVIHKKGSAGENVEIMPTNFWQIDSSNNLTKIKYFLPISLVWSHFQPRKNTIRVPVSLFRHCDFGHFLKSENGNKAILLLDKFISSLLSPDLILGKSNKEVLSKIKKCVNDIFNVSLGEWEKIPRL